ncbi:MAG TPA: MarC family protein [Rhizobiaceae bacterium]|nr:MarC family protein [Rhizobiaceae bacterium]
MDLADLAFNALVTIAVTIDPPGLAPLFLALTAGMDRAQRRQVATRASLTAFIVLAVFAAAGAAILSVFGITLPAFRVAGGILLFWIAFEMIFERRHERKDKTATVAITKDHIHNIAAFPLAIPLIAGPGAISATILLSGEFDSVPGRLALIGIIAGVIAVTWVVFLVAERVDKWLGATGRNVLTRLLGVILAALAVQFVADGVRALAAVSPPG